MIITRFSDTNSKKYLSEITDDFPYPFIKSFHDFLLTQGDDVVFFVSENLIIMPVRFYKKYFFKFGQILSPPLRNGNRIDVEWERKFLDEFIQNIIKNKSCDRIIQPHLFSTFSAYPNKSIHSKFGFSFIDLTRTEDELFSNMQKRLQRTIRSEQQKNPEIVFGNHLLNEFYSIYKETMISEQAYYHSFDYFNELVSKMYNNILIAVLFIQEKPAAALFVIYTLHSGQLVYGGVNKQMELKNENKLLHWEVFMKLKTMNVKKCILGGVRHYTQGTKFEKIQAFKERFGTEKEYGYLWKYNVNKLYASSYDLLIQLKNANKSASRDIIDQEKKNTVL
jgi:hypothetical protein